MCVCLAGTGTEFYCNLFRNYAARPQGASAYMICAMPIPLITGNFGGLLRVHQEEMVGLSQTEFSLALLEVGRLEKKARVFEG